MTPAISWGHVICPSPNGDFLPAPALAPNPLEWGFSPSGKSGAASLAGPGARLPKTPSRVSGGHSPGSRNGPGRDPRTATEKSPCGMDINLPASGSLSASTTASGSRGNTSWVLARTPLQDRARTCPGTLLGTRGVRGWVRPTPASQDRRNPAHHSRPAMSPRPSGGLTTGTNGMAKNRTRAGRFPDDCRTEGRSSPEPRQGPGQGLGQGPTPGLVPVQLPAQPPDPDSPFWEEAPYAHPSGWAPTTSAHRSKSGLISAPPGALRGNWRIRSAHPCSTLQFATNFLFSNSPKRGKRKLLSQAPHLDSHFINQKVVKLHKENNINNNYQPNSNIILSNNFI